MGPGFFPTLLGGLLALLGLTLAIPALVRDGERCPRLRLRPLLMVLLGIVVFALLLQPLGFVLSAVRRWSWSAGLPIRNCEPLEIRRRSRLL